MFSVFSQYAWAIFIMLIFFIWFFFLNFLIRKWKGKPQISLVNTKLFRSSLSPHVVVGTGTSTFALAKMAFCRIYSICPFPPFHLGSLLPWSYGNPLPYPTIPRTDLSFVLSCLVLPMWSSFHPKSLAFLVYCGHSGFNFDKTPSSIRTCPKKINLRMGLEWRSVTARNWCKYLNHTEKSEDRPLPLDSLHVNQNWTSP